MSTFSLQDMPKLASGCFTFSRFLSSEEHRLLEATGELTVLLNAFQAAAKTISELVARTGTTSRFSSHDLKVRKSKRLETISNEIFINSFASTKSVGIMISEQSKDVIDIKSKGKYIVAFNSLDGLSNVDCSMSSGSIVSIMLKADRTVPSSKDATLASNEMMAAGYALYGSATTLVVSTGQGANEFVLDAKIGEFFLTERNLKVPNRGNIYSVDEGYWELWDDAIKEYVLGKKSSARGKPYKLRYVGTMVADVHRTVKHGGIFMYPGNKKMVTGKLELLCACKPMAFVVCQAGGVASNGTTSILDVKPDNIHDTSPIFLGSTEDVNDLLGILNKHGRQ